MSRHFIRRYVFSTDHKVIGIQYIFLGLFSAILGTALSMLMRLRLAWPDMHFPLLGKLMPTGFPDGTMSPEFYLALLTIHGTIMVFFLLTTVPLSGFGNFILPIQIGARDMAFPVLNMLSYWTTFAGLLVLLASLFVEGGAPISGWTAYPPLSALGKIAGPGQGAGQTLWICSIALFCAASLLTALNFLTTTLNMRTAGMTLMRMPLTVWAWFTASAVALLAFPVLLGGSILLLLDRLADTSFFLPAGMVVSSKIITRNGGSPILWQHLFWFFGHPEVYIIIIPGMGITSHILSTFARKPIFAYKAMVLAIFSIGFIGFIVWGHHMFASGMSPFVGMVFSMLTLTVGVPSAIKVFNWIATLWGGRIRCTAAMLYALGFVSFFVTGGVTGLLLAQPAIDVYFHDTYFVVAHFHIIMGLAAVFSIFAALQFWFPRMFGRHMSETLGKVHFWITIVGVYSIFIPMHFLGMAGAPRRYAQFTEFTYLKALQPLTIHISWAAFATGAAQLILIFNIFWSMRYGRKAAENPWEATTLEWVDFGEVDPVVHRGPYEYSVPGAPTDFTLQTAPLAVRTRE
jgi:cytochrome c oxidase subunit 1